MKTTKWFKTGEPVPDNAVYLKSELKIVGEHPDDGADWALGPNYIRNEFHLYEIPVENGDIK